MMIGKTGKSKPEKQTESNHLADAVIMYRT